VSARPEDIAAAAARIRELGHVALRQGMSFECAQCGASGTMVGAGRFPSGVVGQIDKGRCAR
jgi:hypothetical protein